MNPQEISEKAVPQQDDATLETPVDITAEDTTEKPVETPVEETVEAPVEAETPAVVPEETSAEPVVAELPDEETAEEPSKESLLNRLKVIAEEVQEISKQELDSLKQTFYKLRNAELDVERKAYLEHGGTEETFMPVADAIEQEFKRVMAIVREKRSKAVAELDKLREENLIKKMAIIDRLKELLESSEDAGKFYSDFKQLQNQWNEIKQVPQAKAKEVWKQYQHYVEKFYDILKLNNEFRDYDFKKNLEIKQRLCEAAEKLAASDDVVSAFH
ncbi:MAG: DUF349 domain-containing protein, partial [Prevotellaceae bacterium]|nr:DUF349 domain-containing protein [Prevotellaceae bacterium]